MGINRALEDGHGHVGQTEAQFPQVVQGNTMSVLHPILSKDRLVPPDGVALIALDTPFQHLTHLHKATHNEARIQELYRWRFRARCPNSAIPLRRAGNSLGILDRGPGAVATCRVALPEPTFEVSPLRQVFRPLWNLGNPVAVLLPTNDLCAEYDAGATLRSDSMVSVPKGLFAATPIDEIVAVDEDDELVSYLVGGNGTQHLHPMFEVLGEERHLRVEVSPLLVDAKIHNLCVKLLLEAKVLRSQERGSSGLQRHEGNFSLVFRSKHLIFLEANDVPQTW
mmetsp:Transcript_81359/g.170103  ORF Transcript_81359/g.170103 Transcript_81359/m.170103 type:complete len:281 (-) Transcript_81359:18-860(-)